MNATQPLSTYTQSAYTQPLPGARPTADAAPRQPQSPAGWQFLGVANIIVSALFAAFWLWLPISLLFGSIGSILGGIGIIGIIAWIYLMRGVIVVERHRAEAVYGEGLRYVAVEPSRRGGFVGWLETQWFFLRSGAFWLGVVHHFLSLLYGLIVVTIALALASSAAFAFGYGLTPSDSPLREEFGGLADLFAAVPWLAWVWAVVGAVLSLALLWGGAYGDRLLNRYVLGAYRNTELRTEVAELSQARIGAVDAAETERRRIERNLHDGAQPRLVALSMTLGMARAKFDSDPERSRALLDEAHVESKAAINDLRQLARGIHPAVLEDRGLDAALSALAARSITPVELHTELTGRPDSEAESVAYFVVAEALTNANKHAGASLVRVTVGHRDNFLEVTVVDDGVGGARVSREGDSTGLSGLADRVTAARGTFNLTSPNGGPTTLVVTLPCAS